MNPTLRNVLVVLAGIILGSVINMGIIYLGMSIIPAPEGVDLMDPESLKANIDKFETRHFIFPFLAHALGAFAGAFLGVKLAKTQHLRIAMIVAGCFLLGGIYNAISIPAPLTFILLDLIVAYIPMGWLAHRLASPQQ